MHPERWQTIENLCHESLGRKPDERAGFLDAACAGDAGLRREVESLLKYAGLTDDPLDRSTGEGVTRLVGELMEPTLLSGTTIGHYRIETVLGVGGMGQVYRALDVRLGRPVALKFLNGPFFADGAERLVREARAAARLDHPNICSIYEVVEDESRCFIVMQYVEGETLAARIARTPMDIREALEITAQIGNALGEAHARGIVHRDVKPQNIVITPRGQAKVLDFGLAKSITTMDASKNEAEASKHATEKGLVAGTVAYMSPEQVRGHELDARTDLFSLAVVLFEVATGVPPFRSTTVPLTLHAILNEPPAAPRQINPTLPAELERIILKGLAKDRELRYQSASELLADLERLQRDLQVRGRRTLPHRGYATAGLVAAAVAATFVLSRSESAPSVAGRPPYVQLTNFTESAVAPVLSPDGRRVAFFRSDNWFLTTDQAYVKTLPDGEPVQLTHDSKLKYGLAFSPDGSRVAYTVAEGGPSVWNTVTVSALGGEPSLLLSNASGLTWLDERRLLFSEIETGEHMGVVTATENRSEYRKVYFPQHERTMAHFSYPSPNRKWALVMEMNPVWQPCRVIPLDGSSPGRPVGPRGPCTSTAWSPDGEWMYFGAEVEGHHHLWRQRFPNGEPEQITFGPTEEDGVAVAPDGRSLITSIGLRESAVWVHDPRGEHPISSEGHVVAIPGWSSSVRFSADGRLLFYLMRRESPASASELWRTDLESGKSERALPGVAMTEYDISADGKEVVFSTQPPGKASQLWLAPSDRSSPPKLIASTGEAWPRFGPDGQVLFLLADGNAYFLARMKKDGSGRSKVVPSPISNVYSTSPDRRWIVVSMPSPDASAGHTVAVPTGGGAARRICVGFCPVEWAPDGQFFYVGIARSSRTGSGKTLAIPVPPGESLPGLPHSGIDRQDGGRAFPGSSLIDGWTISPGPDPSIFAYVKTTMHRNLFRIPLRDD